MANLTQNDNEEKPTEEKPTKETTYVCVTPCYLKGVYYKKGDKADFKVTPPKHFEKVK